MTQRTLTHSATRVGRCGLVLLAAVLSSSPASAEEDRLPLSADLRPLANVYRSAAPVLCELDLDWAGPELFPTVLEIVVHDGLGTLARVRRDDIVLSNGRRTLSIVLPPVPMADNAIGLEVSVAVIHEGRRIELQRRRLALSNRWMRSHLVAVCGNWQGGTAYPQPLVASLPIEQFLASPDEISLRTEAVRLEPAQFPAAALEYCAFDVVVLTSDGLAELESEQLTALHDWVRAGGSLIAQPARAPGEQQAQFLNRLFDASPGSPPLPGAALGEPLFDGNDGNSRFRTAHPGLGRVILLAPEVPADELFSSVHWRRTVAWLWSIRHEQLNAIARQGVWDLELTKMPENVSVHGYGNSQIESINKQPLSIDSRILNTGPTLLRTLIPEDVETVPFSVVAGMLFLYAVVIGPGDYWLLGKLRIRKWTWIAFPAVTVLFAVAALGLSNRYLGRTDHRRSVVIYDLGENGMPVRSSRFELNFSGGVRQVETPIRQAIRTSLDHSRLASRTDWNYQRFLNNHQINRSERALLHDGRFPQIYTDRDRLPQWSPKMYRWLSIPPEPAPHQPDWSTAPAPHSDSAKFRQALTNWVTGAFGVRASAELVHLQERTPLTSSPMPFDNHHQMNYVSHDALGRPIDSTAFLAELSGATSPGRTYFDLVSQTAPGGAASFDDLLLLDSSDPRQWLLIVSLKHGDDILVYRKLFQEDAP